jgi:alpha-L-fucosidase
LPTWDSLAKHPTPAWYDDAKFGIYFHWGPYSVPAFDNEWYSRNMYQAGSRAHQHHLATYGHPSTFGYKDFVPLFRAERFDPEAWVDLFVEAGARYAGPVATHADGYVMWDSKLTRWNAAGTGPQRDVVGEMSRAVCARGLKFFTSFHHNWLWAWYPTDDPSVDAGDPRYSDLYGPPAPPSAFHPTNDPLPGPEFNAWWSGLLKEAVDRYQPDVIYFDSRLSIIQDAVRRDFLAHYYNRAAEWGREVVVTYKDQDLAPGSGIIDWERGRLAEGSPVKWTTDDAIDWDSWSHVTDAHYKSTKRLVDELVDIVSKNGNFLLDICPTAAGEIPEPIQARLRELGAWLRLYGEAIYGTRPWTVYGEGPTRVKQGHFGEAETPDSTAEDIRFTTKGDVLYATVLGWPADGRVTIRSLAAGSPHYPGEVARIELLGAAVPLAWARSPEGLAVTLPPQPPCDHAVVLRITG